jgi:hypothetical protein
MGNVEVWNKFNVLVRRWNILSHLTQVSDLKEPVDKVRLLSASQVRPHQIVVLKNVLVICKLSCKIFFNIRTNAKHFSKATKRNSQKFLILTNRPAVHHLWSGRIFYWKSEKFFKKNDRELFLVLTKVTVCHENHILKFLRPNYYSLFWNLRPWQKWTKSERSGESDVSTNLLSVSF